MKLSRVKYKQYAGLRIRGTVPQELTNPMNHVHRAAYLTAQVESGGKFGSVMSYDGTGITAGLHQAIAVYPREMLHEDNNTTDDQGPLFKLLRRLDVSNSIKVLKLHEMLLDIGMYVSHDGVLRYTENGSCPHGLCIRHHFTGDSNGCMPASGPGRKRAEMWATAFHEAFSDPATFGAQVNYGEEHIVKRTTRTKLYKSSTYKDFTIQNIIYHPKHISAVTTEDIEPELDLAMAMFFSNTVNAPGAALIRLCRTIPLLGKYGPVRFAKGLIAALGNTAFGRWDDDLKNGRYQRTRNAARKIWPERLFIGKAAIMPKDLPG